MLTQLWSILNSYSAQTDQLDSSLAEEIQEYCKRPFPIIISSLNGLGRLNQTSLATELSYLNISFDKPSIDTVISGIAHNRNLTSISFQDCTFEKDTFLYLMANISNSLSVEVNGKTIKKKLSSKI